MTRAGPRQGRRRDAFRDSCGLVTLSGSRLMAKNLARSSKVSLGVQGTVHQLGRLDVERRVKG